MWNIAGTSTSVLFFIISGCFLLPIAPGGTTQFLKKRLKRLVAPFIIYTTAYIVLSYLLGDISRSMMIEKLNWMWIVGGNPTSWFMFVITAAYLFMPYISPWLWHATKHQVELFLLLWLAASLIPFIEPYTAHLQWSNFDQSGSWLRMFYGYFGFLILGYYLVRWPFATWSRRRKRVILILCLFLITFVPLAYFFKYEPGNPMRFLPSSWYTPSSIAKSFILYILCIRITRTTGFFYRCVRFTSGLNYAIYLCHPIYTWVVLPHIVNVNDNYMRWCYFPLVMSLTLLTVWSLSKLPVIGRYMR